MRPLLHHMQPPVKTGIARWVNDQPLGARIRLRMVATRIHNQATSTRRHFIREWMERRTYKPVDIVKGIGADKGLVSRWLNKGVVPGDDHLEALAGFLGADDPMALFRHPDDDWMARFLRDRPEEEVTRIREVLERAFPKKVA